MRKRALEDPVSMAENNILSRLALYEFRVQFKHWMSLYPKLGWNTVREQDDQDTFGHTREMLLVRICFLLCVLVAVISDDWILIWSRDSTFV